MNPRVFEGQPTLRQVAARVASGDCPQALALSVVRKILEAKTKRLKKRSHRAVGRWKRKGKSRKPSGWPPRLQQAAEAEFQHWQNDVFMYVAHKVLMPVLAARGLQVDTDIPVPKRVAEVIDESGGWVVKIM